MGRDLSVTIIPCGAMTADTSSSAAARIPVVGGAAAASAAQIVEPIFAKSVAAAAITSGTAIASDIPHLPPTYHDPAVAQLR